MFEEKEAENEERKRYIEELVAEYSRGELNEIASGLGLDPDDYPNKRSIAEAILVAREHEEAPMEEALLEYPIVEEVTKEVEKVSPDTVRGKIKAIMDSAVEFNAAAQTFQRSVQAQVKENEDAVKNIHAFAPVFQQSVAAFQQTVQAQVKENEAALAAIKSGVQELMSGIQEQVKEHENFVKQFYG